MLERKNNDRSSVGMREYKNTATYFFDNTINYKLPKFIPRDKIPQIVSFLNENDDIKVEATITDSDGQRDFLIRSSKYDYNDIDMIINRLLEDIS